jgi:phenylalanyl-tRNA synthetase alpha chain
MEKYPTEEKGHLHPLSQLITEISEIFADMGFTMADGPEVESVFNNFDALNVPADHPSRDMQDTFFLATPKSADENGLADVDMVLRTHTSPVQVRYMKNHKPPLRIVAAGKVFRNEATDATHEAQFYQLEGLCIDKEVSMAHLKGTLETFFKRFFGEEVKIRFRPSFFPFVEPGVEVDMSCFKCGGTGCALCKQTGWVEVLGAGLVHPNVLKACGVDPSEWQGFAFGVGLDRIAMMKYGVDDVRAFYGGDLRLVEQF